MESLVQLHETEEKRATLEKQDMNFRQTIAGEDILKPEIQRLPTLSSQKKSYKLLAQQKETEFNDLMAKIKAE